ncbi:S9 family peptidase [candidate division KSB1 bacterium]|nr:S9 family peptidase [candidate division KSB1 bacterium]
MKQCILLGVAVLFAFLFMCSKKDAKISVPYPETVKVDQVDDYFGTRVADPYRWLEDDTSAATAAWVRAQNAVTMPYLEQIPFREKIKNRLTELFNYPRYSNPFRAGQYYFFSKNDGLQNQSVIYYQKGLDGEPQVFLDPNTFSPDGTVAINLAGFSKDRKYVAYSLRRSGSDWQEMYVMEVATRRQLPDKLEWLKFTGAAWKDDGFFYSRYDAPARGKELSQVNENQKIYYHKLGDLQSKDRLVFTDKKHPLRYFSAQTTDDERFLLLYVSEGTDNNELYYRDLKLGEKGFRPLFTGFNSKSYVIDNLDDQLLVQTNVDAPNHRVVLINPRNPEEAHWTNIISEKPELLQSAGTAGGKIFAEYLKDVSSRVYQYDTRGRLEREIELPTMGSAYGFSGEKDDVVVFYTFSSFTFPPAIYKYEISDGKTEVFKRAEAKFNPEDYETKQVFYPSKDGTKIPMFITHKKGLKLNGNNPTKLYAYGGFNASMTPYFSISNIILLEQGGVYAVANLRGGGEYGEKWHQAGMLEKKQNVFDDFIAGAEYLIKERYTRPERLAIEGASNGGLLVGAAITQRPELFQVALPAVGVMDMLRFHKFTCGWGWIDEYGSSDDPEQFKYLYAYSPLHNIKEGVPYPATLVTTADHDDRVVPAHSFKFISTLQEKHRGANPVLIRVDVKAGHGGGKPLTKAIEELADKWAFIFYNMGISI